jgi:hypothetical protein
MSIMGALMNTNMNRCNLSPLALGLSFGLVWGVSVLVTGLLSLYFSYGTPFVIAMGTIYIGYESTIIGSLIGGAFGFVDGLIGGVLIGAIYNLFVRCCSCCSTSCGTSEPKKTAVKAKVKVKKTK